MCGRYAAGGPIDLIAGHFGVDDVEDELTPPGFNVAPTDRVPVVIEREERRQVVGMRWGLVPSWSANTAGAARMINARLETLAEKPAFRTPLARRRAIVPADAYYEWQTTAGGKKQPYAIGTAAGGLLAFAGLWERWRSASGEVLLSCTIVTTASKGEISYLHDRMPVVLPPDAWDDWLDRDRCGAADALALLHAAGATPLRAYPVSPRVNNVRADGGDLLDEVAEASAPQQLGLLW